MCQKKEKWTHTARIVDGSYLLKFLTKTTFNQKEKKQRTIQDVVSR